MIKTEDISKNLHFPPVPYAHIPVKKLSPEKIDELLANAYFRNGLKVCSALVRYISGHWRPCLMLRVSLTDFRWKKRSRKLLRRNAKIFDVQIQPFWPRGEMEELWKLFKTKVHQWDNVSKVAEYLSGGFPASNFQTYEIAVYRKQQLVAFSLFDRGHKSIASLEAAYHPDFKEFSLGYYTMLLELEYAQQNMMSWYYPGFLPKGLPMFEYKLRPGGLEFFQLQNQTWQEWDSCTDSDWLIESVQEKLHGLQSFFKKYDIHSDLLKQFPVNVPGQNRRIEDHQFFLEIFQMMGKKSFRRFRVGYDIIRRQFEVFTQEMALEKIPHQSKSKGRKFIALGPFCLSGIAKSEEMTLNLCHHVLSSSGKK